MSELYVCFYGYSAPPGSSSQCILTERKHFPDLVLDGKAGKYNPVGGKYDCFSKAKVVFWDP